MSESKRVDVQSAREALDSLDDYARMGVGVDAHGPRGMLERFIDQVAELGEDARRAIEAWDATTLHRCNDGMLQERMESLRAQLNDRDSMPDEDSPEWTEEDSKRAEPAPVVLERIFGKPTDSEDEVHGPA